MHISQMDNFHNELNGLVGARNAILQTTSAKILELDNVNEVLAQKSRIEDVLKSFEKDAFAESGKQMESLLSKMLTDVFTNEQSVELQTRIKNGFAELHITANNTDIVNGRGGSVVNVVATSLQIISLLKSKDTRPTLWFDESDCWLESSKVAPYFAVLSKICSDLGVQIIYLSHHKNIPLAKATSKILLEKKSDSVITTSTKGDHSNITNNEATKQRISRQIARLQLEDVLSHKNTSLELSQGLNLLHGSNDLGKSSILRGLDALRTNTFGGGNEHFIRDDNKTCAVTVTFNDGFSVEWSADISNSRKGAKGLLGVKTKYSLFQLIDGEHVKIDETHLKLGDPVPTYISAHIGMPVGKGLIDPSVTHQLQPLGLLNPVLSRADRAKLIDLGEKYTYSVKLFEAHKVQLSSLRSKKKAILKFIDELNAQSAVFAPLEMMILMHDESTELQRELKEIDFEQLKKDASAEIPNNNNISTLTKVSESSASLLSLTESLSYTAKLDADLQTALQPINTPSKELDDLIMVCKSLSQLTGQLTEAANLQKDLSALKTPVVSPNAMLASLVQMQQKLSSLTPELEAIAKVDNKQESQTVDTSAFKNITSLITALHNQATSLEIVKNCKGNVSVIAHSSMNASTNHIEQASKVMGFLHTQTQSLNSVLQEFHALQQSTEKTENAIQELIAYQQSIKEQLTLLENAGKCPKCGYNMNEQHSH